MSSVNVLNIVPKNPITKFTDQFSFNILIEVLAELKKEIEWKMVYITSENQNYDQILNDIEIDPPNQLGQMKFVFEGDAPDISKIPENDVIGVAAILLCCSYNGKEFFRCGYYLNITYDNEEMNINMPEKINVEHLVRNMLSDKPRIVKYEIDWEGDNDNKENVNEGTGHFMFNEGKMNQEKFKDMEKDKNNNGNNF